MPSGPYTMTRTASMINASPIVAMMIDSTGLPSIGRNST